MLDRVARGIDKVLNRYLAFESKDKTIIVYIVVNAFGFLFYLAGEPRMAVEIFKMSTVAIITFWFGYDLRDKKVLRDLGCDDMLRYKWKKLKEWIVTVLPPLIFGLVWLVIRR